jgi:hypothetical protein
MTFRRLDASNLLHEGGWNTHTALLVEFWLFWLYELHTILIFPHILIMQYLPS